MSLKSTGTITDFDVPMNETDINRAVSNPKLEEGFYNLVVTTAKSRVTKTGNMSIQMGTLPVDADGETRTPGANLFLTVPVKTPVEILEVAGLPDDAQKNVPGKWHMTRARQYIKAVNSAMLSPHPLFHPETKSWTLDGSEISDTEATDAKKVVAREVFKFFNEIWKDPGLLVGGSFYARISYKEGNQFPNIDSIGSSLPEGETTVL